MIEAFGPTGAVGALAAEAPASACAVDVPYLLVLNLGLLRGSDGRYYADPSWAKDLLRHATYLPQLTYLAPIDPDEPPPEYERLPDGALTVIGYRSGRGRVARYAAMLRLLLLLLREVPRARIVHSCIAGYPFPAGWLAVPLARWWGKKIVITVESSPWRLRAGIKAGLGQRVTAAAWERINRWCMRQADYASYPHEDYRASLPAPRAGGGVLFQASWIDAEQVVSCEFAHGLWTDRRASANRPRFLFCARMLPEKGTRVLAAAIERLDAEQADVAIDLIGTGPELDRLATLRERAWGRDHLRVLAPVPYGPPLFALLRDYHAVLVPNLAEEQPRIVYDAYSQAIPVIASDTAGLRVCVADGVTGRLVPTGDPGALADAMVDLARDPGLLETWGLAAREAATRFTHDQMHADRCRELQRLL